MIGRNQTWEETKSLYDEARRLGFESINIDLIYGLPGQNLDTMGATLEKTIEMLPDRLAVYSFAYVPWVKPNQKRIAGGGLGRLLHGRAGPGALKRCAPAGASGRSDRPRPWR